MDPKHYVTFGCFRLYDRLAWCFLCFLFGGNEACELGWLRLSLVLHRSDLLLVLILHFLQLPSQTLLVFSQALVFGDQFLYLGREYSILFFQSVILCLQAMVCLFRSLPFGIRLEELLEQVFNDEELVLQPIMTISGYLGNILCLIPDEVAQLLLDRV